MAHDLIDAVRRYTEAQAGESPFITAIDGLIILRANHEQPPNHLIFKPALCVVVQGVKWAQFGGQRLDYRAGQALVVCVEMPLFGRVAEASPHEPYLGVIIEFDLAIMREVLEQLTPAPPHSERSGVFVVGVTGPVGDCVLRLVRLLDTPQAVPLLYPLIMRELCYWLLIGPYGGEVAALALANSHARSVIRAIHALRDRFAEPVRIDELAGIALMSSSEFHRQFKALTALTPLQYQKHLRLVEARRLMMTDAANVETAALAVGYESPSQFSRDYARFFGAPPRRDINAVKAVPRPEGASAAALHGAIAR